MNPKDMTNEELVFMADTEAGSYDHPIAAEIKRRLDEADALRKENEELRKDKEKLLKDYAELKVNAALLVACDDALESLAAEEAKESEASHEH